MPLAVLPLEYLMVNIRIAYCKCAVPYVQNGDKSAPNLLSYSKTGSAPDRLASLSCPAYQNFES
jgi:hypothetical protein